MPETPWTDRTDRMHKNNADDVNQLYHELAAALLHSYYSTTQTLSADLTLTDASSPIQFVDPGGADRVVNLPTAAAGNHVFILVNEADADEWLTVMDSTTVRCHLARGERAMLVSNKLGWRVVSDKRADDGWTPVPEAWTYVSATTVYEAGDASLKYAVGDRVRYTQTTVKYGYITAIGAYDSGNNRTLLTVLGGTDYTVANAAISRVSVAKGNAVGFPDWFNYAANPVGWTSAPTTAARFHQDGRKVTCEIYQGSGATSNSTTMQFDIPTTAAFACGGLFQFAQDNGVSLTVPGRVQIFAGASVLNVYKDISGAAWTNSGNKQASLIVEYFM